MFWIGFAVGVVVGGALAVVATLLYVFKDGIRF